MRIQIGFTEVLREQHCYRCGNLLGRSRAVLYYTPRRPRRSAASRVGSSLSRLNHAYRELTGYYERSCQTCGRDSTTEWNRRDPKPPARTHIGRLASLLTDRPERHTVDVTEGGLPEELAGAPFPVYGLSGQPLGLVMRRVYWDARQLRPSVDGIGLLYDTGAGSPPGWKLLLEQTAGSGAANRMKSPVRELRAIVEVVQEHGARGQRERYADRGNVFHYWNLERLPDASRRSVQLSVGGVPVRVDVAQWSDPQQVVLAHVSLSGVAIMAAAVDVPPVRLLAMLKGLAPLSGR